MKKQNSIKKQTKRKPSTTATALIDDLRNMIEKTRQSVALAVNAGLTLLYWHVGNRIRMEILQEERCPCGENA